MRAESALTLVRHVYTGLVHLMDSVNMARERGEGEEVIGSSWNAFSEGWHHGLVGGGLGIHASKVHRELPDFGVYDVPSSFLILYYLLDMMIGSSRVIHNL
jgi:hypothetical protein